MIRALSIIAAVAALAVSAAPVASAGPGSGTGTGVGSDHAWANYHFKAKAGPSKARVGGKMHLEDVSLGVKTKPKPRGISGVDVWGLDRVGR